jgi:hypothetical protein
MIPAPAQALRPPLARLDAAAKVRMPGRWRFAAAVIGAILFCAIFYYRMQSGWDVGSDLRMIYDRAGDALRDGGQVYWRDPIWNNYYYAPPLAILFGLVSWLPLPVLHLAIVVADLVSARIITGAWWSAFALGAFPMDDVWHRIFGQDVTLWGPTHLVLIGGAGLATVGGLILLAEGISARGGDTPRDQPSLLLGRRAAQAGAFLIALSTFQAEFDFAVPQFRLVWHPILLMLAAGIGLVSARIVIGRGGALMALVLFLLVRGLLSLFVGPIAGHTDVHFPLYLVEALVVEAVALRIDPVDGVRFGAIAGLGVGTIGLAAEWGWSHVWWTIPWTGALLPEGVIAGVIAGIAGGVIGGFIGSCLQQRAPRPAWAPALAGVAAIGLFAFALQMNGGPGTKATVTLHDASPPPRREVNMTVKLDPPDAADNAEWFNATAWQGGGSVVEKLKKVGPGTYRTTKPIPVYDNWKSTLRLQKGATVAGLPVYMPADPAIPVKEIPARDRFTRTFVRDKKNLQREQKKGVSSVLSVAAYLIVLGIFVGLIASLAWGLLRFARREAPVSSS